MLELHEVKAHNFRQFPKIEFNLHKAGLVLIEGEVDNTPVWSNGAGKTAFLSLVPWIIWEQYLGGLKNQKDVVRWGRESCRGELHGFYHNTSFNLDRTRLVGRNSSFTASLGSSSRKPDSKVEMNTYFDSFETIKNHVILTKDSVTEFINSSDPKRKQLIEELLRLGEFNTGLKNVREDLTWLRNKRNEITYQIDSLESKQTIEINDIGHRLEMYHSNMSMSQKNLQTQINHNVNQLETLRTTLSQTSNAKDKLKRKVERAEEDCDHYDRERNGVLRDNVKYQEKHKKLKRLLAAAQSKVCSECGQNTPGNPEIIQQLTRDLNLVDQDLETFTRTIRKCEHNFRSARAAFRELNDQYVECKTLINQGVRTIATLEQQIADLQNELDDLNKRESYDYTLDLPRLIQRQRHIDHLNNVIGMIDQYVPYLQFWEKGYGHHGIPSLLIEHALPVINEQANLILSEIHNGRFKLEIGATQKAKTKRPDLDRINFQIWDNGRKVNLDAASGGQKKTIVLSIYLALSRTQHVLTGRRWNVRFFDELFDEIDEGHIYRIMDILKNIVSSGEIDTILITSHNNQLKSHPAFDERWLIVNRRGKSQLVV